MTDPEIQIRPLTPAEEARRRKRSVAIALDLLLVFVAIGLALSVSHWRQLRRNAAVDKLLYESEQRFRDFAEASSERPR